MTPLSLAARSERRAVRPRALTAGLVLSLAALCAAVPPTRGAAQTPGAARDTTVLPAIEVIGSILSAVGPAVGSAVPARASTLDMAAVGRRRPRTLAQALAGQVGVSAYDDLGSPYKLTLRSRGFTASPVVGLPQGITVFLDGVPVNEPDAAQVNFDLLPLAHVARVEVLSGTASLLGPNALGGAINLVTRRGDASGGGAPAGEIELSAGSYGRRAGEAAVGGMRGGWSYYAGGSIDRDRGWRQVTGARLGNLFVNVGRLGDRAGLTFQAYGARSRAETAGSLPASVYAFRPDSNLSAQDFEDLDQLHVAVAGYRTLGAGRASMRLFARRHDAERFNVNQVNDPDVRSFSANRTIGGSVDWRVAGAALGGAAALRVGASGTANRVGVRILADFTKFGRGDSLTTDVASPIARGGAFAAGDVRWGRVTVSAGARYDVVRVPFRNRLRPERDTTSVYRRLNPRGGASVALGRGLSAYASLGQSFRAPAVIELACADPEEPCPLPFALGDDPPLAPVVATTGEVGARWAAGRALVSASAYRTNVRDDIFLLPYDEEGEPEGSTIDGFFANVPRTRREGVELEAALQATARFALTATYAYTRATFRSEAEIFSIREEAGEENEVEAGDRLPLVPAHALGAGGALSLPGGVEIGASVRHTGAQWLRGDEANETAPLAAYTVADVRLGVDVGAWGVSLLVDNVLDRRYATFGTFNLNQGAGDRLERFLTPGQPRTVRVSLRRAFGAAAMQ